MQTPPLANRDLMRAINRSAVLNVIKTWGPIARASVARRTGLSPATVTGITADLIQEELVFEKASGDSSGGRPPILLALNPSGGFVVGIKLTEKEAIGALTDLEANLLARRSRRLESQEPDWVVEDLVQLSAELFSGAGLPQRKLLGVGVGLAGIVDSKRGVLRQSPFLNWRDLPLRDRLQDRLHAPVYVDNDVNTLTQAEKWFGSGQGVDHFLVVTVGRGIGMGVVVNDQFYRGAEGGAGELGHTLVQPGGPVCDCGKQGCLEALVGERGLLRAGVEAGCLPAEGSVDDLLNLACRGEQAAVQIFASAGAVLGQSLANLVNLFNPQKIIIGGEGVRYGDLFFIPLKEALVQYAIPVLLSDVQIQIEPWGDEAWARGAASLVLRELFVSPVHREAPVQVP